MSATKATASSDAAQDPKATQIKPEKPDEEQYKAAVEKARKELASAQEATKAAQAKVNGARPGNKDSPVVQRQQALRAQLAEIKQKQQGLKTSRSSVQDRVEALDGQLKSRINEQKNARAKIPFKSAEDIDREIQRLEKQVDTGTMKLVDERKTLTDITALRKQRKAFAGFDESQKVIDDLKAQISELKKGFDNPESKALSEQFAAAAKELDEIKAQQDSTFKSLNTSRDALTKARTNQDQKYAALKAIQDKYFNDKRAYHDYEREAHRVRQARQKAERDAYFQTKRRRDADESLEKASTPAYLDEIRSARSLLQRLDPTFSSSGPTTATGKFAATAQRTVEAGDMKGTRIVGKSANDDDYFQGTGGKKGKKNKKSGNEQAGAPPTKVDLGFFMNPGVLQEMSALEVDVPSSQSDVPNTIEKLKEKLKFMEDNQDKQTKENIAAAQRKIETLEAEAKEAENGSSHDDRKTAAASAQTNGSTAEPGTSVASATEKLAETSITDETAKATADGEKAATAASTGA